MRPEGEVLVKELLSGAIWDAIPLEHRLNLSRIFYITNFLRKLSGVPFQISSGYRTETEHTRIYAKKNAARKEAGLPALRIPWGSYHLIGAAVDISDPRGEVKHFLLDHLEYLERHDLYLENPMVTSPDDAKPWDRWIHIQIYPPKSGKRFFDP